MNKSKKFIVFFSALEFTNNKMEKALEIVEKYKYKKEVNPHAINPEYLKLTEAEESKQAC